VPAAVLIAPDAVLLEVAAAGGLTGSAAVLDAAAAGPDFDGVARVAADFVGADADRPDFDAVGRIGNVGGGGSSMVPVPVGVARTNGGVADVSSGDLTAGADGVVRAAVPEAAEPEGDGAAGAVLEGDGVAEAESVGDAAPASAAAAAFRSSCSILRRSASWTARSISS
jgi:hypothetical protein